MASSKLDIVKELKSAYPDDVVDALIEAFDTIESNFSARKWKASELDAGHFVEATRRVIEHVLFGKHTPIGKSLPNFNDKELRRYEQAQGDESIRILIPRMLKSIYGIRNKRGVGHIGLISPNEMDSTYILYSVKWVLAELLRLASGKNPDVVQGAISQIVERQTPLIWKSGDIVRIIEPKCGARDQILIHLYDQSPQKVPELMEKIEYKNRTNFLKIVKRLHSKGLIHMASNEECLITPAGIPEAEKHIHGK